MTIYGIGTDLTQRSRIQNLWQKDAAKFEARVLTAAEISVAPKNEAARISYISRRYAGKEAVAKSLGTGIGENLSFQDISILREGNQRPQVVLSDACLVHHPQRLNVHLSLSDDGDFALAYAVAEV